MKEWESNIQLKGNNSVKPEQKDQGNHKRSSTHNLPQMKVIDNDQYQLNQINEFKELKDTLKANIKYYKALINSNQSNAINQDLIDPSIENIHITMDTSLKTSKNK